jgi:hypothetical protein
MVLLDLLGVWHSVFWVGAKRRPGCVATKHHLGLAGGALGAAIFIWGGYIAHEITASAQAPRAPQAGGVPPSADQLPPVPSGASGNFNFNQQGGTNYQFYVNPAPQKLAFTDALGAELPAKIPIDKPITVEAVG